MKGEVAAVFGRAAETYDTVIPFFAHFGALLVDAAGPASGEHVLDVAAGRGASALPALERVGPEGRVVAVDLSPEMVSHLRAGGLEAHVMDAESLDFPDHSFDVVLCGMSVMFFPDLTGVFRQWRRVLRPGGRVAVSTFCGANKELSFLGDVLRPHLAKAGVSPPPTPPTHDLDVSCKATGFGRIEHRGCEATFVLPDEDAWWRWIWSQGQRAMLERLPESAVEQVRDECFARLRPHRRDEGYVLTQRARLTLLPPFWGRNPAP